jgi:CrcB protein
VSAGHRVWVVVAVAVGGALGTIARYELSLVEPLADGRFPWATFVANVIGSFVLGIAVVTLTETRPSGSVPRALVAVGFCGGLTTFSTWMVESVLLTRDGDGGVAVLYLVASLVVGFTAVALGVGAARRAAGRPRPAFDPELDD